MHDSLNSLHSSIIYKDPDGVIGKDLGPPNPHFKPCLPPLIFLFQQITKGVPLLGPLAWKCELTPNRVIFQNHPSFSITVIHRSGSSRVEESSRFQKSPSQEPTDLAAERKFTRGFLLENQNLTALCGFRRPGLMERAFRLFANLPLPFHFCGVGGKTSSKERLLPCGYKMCQAKGKPQGTLEGFLLQNPIF